MPKLFVLMRDEDAIRIAQRDWAEYEIVVVFNHMVNCNPTYTGVYNKLCSVLEDCYDGDKVLMNGPPSLIALASYIWFTYDHHTQYDVLLYNEQQRRYVEMRGDIPEEAA